MYVLGLAFGTSIWNFHFSVNESSQLTNSFKQLISQGSAKLASVPSGGGGGGVTAAGGGPAAGGAAAPTEEEKKPEKEEEKEESDEDMGFGLFD